MGEEKNKNKKLLLKEILELRQQIADQQTTETKGNQKEPSGVTCDYLEIAQGTANIAQRTKAILLSLKHYSALLGYRKLKGVIW